MSDLSTTPSRPGPRHEEQPESKRTRSGARARQRKARRMRKRIIIAVIAVLVLVAGAIGTHYIYESFRTPDFASGSETTDTVEITVYPGDSGTDIGQALYDGGVIASVKAFILACDQNDLSDSIQPGTYRLPKHMAAADALAELVGQTSRIDTPVTVAPGDPKWRVARKIGEVLDIPEEQAAQAFNDPEAIGLPDVAKGNVEGWLAPGTYTIAPGTKPDAIVKEMIERTIKTLKKFNIPRDKWQDVLIKSSIVLKEGHADDYSKVARVIENRLVDNEETHQLLQMDSTVLYGLGPDAPLIPTAAQNADESNPYNTYTHKGLPPSPIGAVSEEVIKATLHPEKGNWLYFTTVNLDTGETKFASTKAEQDQLVEEFRQFCKDNPNSCER